MCWIQGRKRKVRDDTSLAKSNDGKHKPETSTKTSKLCYGITISNIVHYINLTTGPSTLKGSSLCHFHIGGRRLVVATDAVDSQKTPGLGFSKLD